MVYFMYSNIYYQKSLQITVLIILELQGIVKMIF